MTLQTSRQSNSTTAQRAVACALSLLAIIAATTMSGCIVREIRDEMVVSIQSIAETNQLLQGIRDDINQTNAHLAALQERLGQLHEQLKKLDSIDTSLAALDAHMASLRQTLESIDSVIPFVSFADEPEDEATTQAATQPATQPATVPASQQSEAAPQPAKKPPPSE